MEFLFPYLGLLRPWFFPWLAEFLVSLSLLALLSDYRELMSGPPQGVIEPSELPCKSLGSGRLTLIVILIKVSYVGLD